MNGLCQCGCATTIAAKSSRRYGYVKGQPKRFVHGHAVRLMVPYDRRGTRNPKWRGGRVVRSGYIELHRPDHPRASKMGYVPEQVIVAEAALGKFLPPLAIVHHVNANRGDNQNKNLVVCENQAYHNLIHQRQRALAACGHANWRKCHFCKHYDAVENLSIDKTNRPGHRACIRKTRREEYARRKAAA